MTVSSEPLSMNLRNRNANRVKGRQRKGSPPLTEEMAAIIKKLARDTDLVQHQIAAKLEINQGRVSEVLSGKRFEHVSPSD